MIYKSFALLTISTPKSVYHINFSTCQCHCAGFEGINGQKRRPACTLDIFVQTRVIIRRKKAGDDRVQCAIEQYYLHRIGGRFTMTCPLMGVHQVKNETG